MRRDHVPFPQHGIARARNETLYIPSTVPPVHALLFLVSILSNKNFTTGQKHKARKQENNGRGIAELGSEPIIKEDILCKKVENGRRKKRKHQ